MIVMVGAAVVRDCIEYAIANPGMTMWITHHPDELAAIKRRLLAEAQELRRVASDMPHSGHRDLLLAKADELKVSATIDGWLASSELRPPSR